MNRTIAAISTPNAIGGIAMLRVSGPDALTIAEQVFQPISAQKVTEMRGYSCAYGHIFDGEETLDDVVLTVFRAPHSFTGEDTVEITCHGGIYLSRRILALLFRHGAEPADPGEFTERSFLNGKMSLSQAEAVMEIIRANSDAALRQANLAKDGTLAKEMEALSAELVELMSAFAYWLDDAEEFPEELERNSLISSLKTFESKLSAMAAGYQNGKLLREGIRTVLLGRPNAGKSSVMNALCGTNRSIVTEIAGTTRDVITEQVQVGSLLLLLSDTAGLRETENAIESIGISHAYQALDTADLVLYVIDAAVGISPEDTAVLEKCVGRKVLILWNKNDLTHSEPPALDFPVLSCSATQDHLSEKLEFALRSLLALLPAINQPVIINERQYALILKSEQSVSRALDLLCEINELDLIHAELEDAARSLRAITGENVSEDVIRGVFSKFCVGK